MESYFKVKKKGKTKGRPSRQEKTTEAICDYWYENNKMVFEAVYKDVLLYGVGISRIKFRKFLDEQNIFWKTKRT